MEEEQFDEDIADTNYEEDDEDEQEEGLDSYEDFMDEDDEIY